MILGNNIALVMTDEEIDVPHEATAVFLEVEEGHPFGVDEHADREVLIAVVETFLAVVYSDENGLIN